MMSIDFLFQASNLFVLPFWALMILLPNWSITRKVMDSLIPFVALSLLYLYLFISSLDPANAAAFSNPQLADLARLFSQETVMATGWTHFLVMDLFVGRWIYWEGQQKGVWTIHSLILCLFAGPIGLLSHLTTAAIQQRLTASRSNSSANDTAAAS